MRREEIVKKIVMRTVLIAKERDTKNLISAVLFPEDSRKSRRQMTTQ